MLGIQHPARAREDPHRRIGGQSGAVVGQGQRDRQELLHLVDPAHHQRRELADAVAEAQDRIRAPGPRRLPRAAGPGPAPSPRSSPCPRRTSRAWMAPCEPSARPGQRLLQHVCADDRRPVQDRSDDRTVDGCARSSAPRPEVARVIAAERDGRGGDLFLQVITSQVLLTRGNTQHRDLFGTRADLPFGNRDRR